MVNNFTLVLTSGFIVSATGFILILRGTKWLKPWGKQYKIINGRKVLLGVSLLLLGFIFVLWQAGIRQ
ncbi:hypothetical protein AB3K25_07855 [Leuconostoc sp. MS02]|uniref:Uncharacterized protein n=1 Tax=Leuconostoc aquikimchii TaxID=3236804 RepID=A0ABV3S1F4_9LACO